MYAPRTIEARVVYDADKLDAIGDEGIKRVVEFCRAMGYSSNETAKFYLWQIIGCIREVPLYTKTARELAGEKVKRSLDFCKENLGQKYDEIVNQEFGSIETFHGKIKEIVGNIKL